MTDGDQRLPMTGRSAAEKKRLTEEEERLRRKAERDAALVQALEKLR